LRRFRLRFGRMSMVTAGCGQIFWGVEFFAVVILLVF
jgi:hypothetical protein